MNKFEYRALQGLKYKAGQIDRRTFLRSLLATGLALPGALSIASSVEAATPKKGGYFRLGMRHGSTTDNLDPGTAENGMATHTNYCWSNHLTEVGSDGKLRGELAESFESEDAKTWVFNLHEGVEFHNGKTLDANDVIATMDYHRSENSRSAAKGLLSAIASIKADGANRVIIELSGANADFPFIMSDYHLSIMPIVDGQLDVGSGLGTGGYILEKHEPGVRAKFKRNLNYWKESAAHFDEEEILSLVDVTARQNAVMDSDVDLIDGADPKTANLIGRSPDLEILEVTGTLHCTFPMRVKVEPFDKYGLSMVLKSSLKRQELVDKFFLATAP